MTPEERFNQRMEFCKPIADKARETFNAIRELRKTPVRTRVEKDVLELKVNQLQDQWWTDVKSDF